MIGEDLIFGGRYLSEFDMKMYAPDEDQQFSTIEYESGDITSLRARPNYYGVTYADQLVLDFLICRDVCVSDSQEDMVLAGEDINLLRSWLESPKLPTELVVLGEEDFLNTRYYGVFSSVQPLVVGGKCYGLKLVFTCDSPYGYSDVHKYTCVLDTGTSELLKIMNTSAEWNEYLRPVVTVTSSSSSGFGADENLTIANQSDNNNTMVIKLPEGVKKLVIDCNKRIATDENGNLMSLGDLGITLPSEHNYNFISTQTYSFYWLALVPSENNLRISTTNASHTIAKVEISVQYILKSGGF